MAKQDQQKLVSFISLACTHKEKIIKSNMSEGRKWKLMAEEDSQERTVYEWAGLQAFNIKTKQRPCELDGIRKGVKARWQFEAKRKKQSLM